MITANRLKEVVNYLRYSGYGRTQKDVAQNIGISATNLSSALKGVEKYLTEGLVDKISTNFVSINRDWLLTGEGEMLRSSSDVVVAETDPAPDEEGAPLTERTALKFYYELEATASNVIGLDDNERNQPFRLLNIPEFAGCIGMMVSGDSMYPSIASGSIVAIDPTPASYIINGETYLVVTRDGQRMIKRLVQQGEKVRCISDNPDKELYAPFEIEAEIIHTISRVRGSVSVRSL